MAQPARGLPRFQLKSGDSQTLKYSRLHSSNQVTDAIEVLNVSAGGAAFLVPVKGDIPSVGEEIQIDLRILDVQPTILKRAAVMRIEPDEKDPTLAKIAVKFIDDAGQGTLTHSTPTLVYVLIGFIFLAFAILGTIVFVYIK